MKKKVVIKLTTSDEKSRKKALKIAVTLEGVDAASLGGQDKSQIEVTGEAIDAAKLTTLLRKKIGHAELVSVANVEPPKKEDPKPKPADPKPAESHPYVVWPSYPVVHELPMHPNYNYSYNYNDPYSCSIM